MEDTILNDLEANCKTNKQTTRKQPTRKESGQEGVRAAKVCTKK